MKIWKALVTLSLLLLFTGINAQRYFVTNQYVYDLFLMNPSAAATTELHQCQRILPAAMVWNGQCTHHAAFGSPAAPGW